MQLMSTLKKHQKKILIGAGILAAIYFVKSSSSSGAKQTLLPIGPTREQLLKNQTTVNGFSGLGSL